MKSCRNVQLFQLRRLAVVVLPLVSTSLFATDLYSVVDGNTVMIEGRKFHLHGIDAPALNEICPASDGRSWPCGGKARDQLAEAMASTTTACQIIGRETVLCRTAGLDVGALLVKEGLAKASDDYWDVEDRARAAKVGIWQ